MKHHMDTKMHDVVQALREGWYGNGEAYANDHPLRTLPVDCMKLVEKTLDIAGTKFVRLYPAILGSMGDLEIDTEYVDEDCTIPIDTLVVNMSNGVAEAEI